jgi:hypothetical protein
MWLLCSAVWLAAGEGFQGGCVLRMHCRRSKGLVVSHMSTVFCGQGPLWRVTWCHECGRIRSYVLSVHLHVGRTVLGPRDCLHVISTPCWLGISLQLV